MQNSLREGRLVYLRRLVDSHRDGIPRVRMFYLLGSCKSRETASGETEVILLW